MGLEAERGHYYLSFRHKQTGEQRRIAVPVEHVEITPEKRGPFGIGIIEPRKTTVILPEGFVDGGWEVVDLEDVVRFG